MSENQSAANFGQKIFDDATDTVLALQGRNIPAADLTQKQRCALFVLAGYMKFEDGKLRSIRPVAIHDDGKGGYVVAIQPEQLKPSSDSGQSPGSN